MLGEGDARKFNLVSLVFLSLSAFWVLIVLVLLVSG